MKVAIVGAGNLGIALAARLKRAGHELALSLSRNPDRLKAEASRLGVAAETPAAASRWADVVLLSVPWAAVQEAIKALDIPPSKILWDCTNALKADFSGLEIGTDTSAGEVVAGLAPHARVVKALPPFAELLMKSDNRIGGALGTTFVCGDDQEAKQIVSALAEQIPTDVVDAGPLSSARFVEPMGMLLVRMAYGLNYGTSLAVRLLQEKP